MELPQEGVGLFICFLIDVLVDIFEGKKRGKLVRWSSLSDEMASEDNWWLRKSSACVDCGRRVAATRIFTFPTARKKNTPFSDGAN